jgi:hypothetical protein
MYQQVVRDILLNFFYLRHLYRKQWKRNMVIIPSLFERLKGFVPFGISSRSLSFCILYPVRCRLGLGYLQTGTEY